MGSKQKAGIKAIGTPQVSVSASVVVTPAAGEQPVVAPTSTPTPVIPEPVGTPVAK